MEKYFKIRLHRLFSQVRLLLYKYPGPVLIYLKESRYKKFILQLNRYIKYIEKFLTPGYITTILRSKIDK